MSVIYEGLRVRMWRVEILVELKAVSGLVVLYAVQFRDILTT